MSSRAKQGVPESVTGLELEELGSDFGTSNIDNSDRQEPTKIEDQKLYSSTAATGSENESPNNRSQRPTRAAKRPTRFRDNEFETQFQPKNRNRKCHKLSTNCQAGSNNNDDKKGAKRTGTRFRSGREVGQKPILDVGLPTGRQLAPSNHARNTTRRPTSHDENTPTKRGRQSLSTVGGPARCKTHSLQPTRAENLETELFKARKCLAICSQQTGYEQSTGNGNQVTSIVPRHLTANVKDLKNGSSANKPATFNKRLKFAHHHSRRARPDATKDDAADNTTDSNLIKKRSTVVSQRSDEAGTPVISRRASGSGTHQGVPTVLSPVPLSKQPRPISATQERNGAIDSNGATETEVKTTEIDPQFPGSSVNKFGLENSGNNTKKYVCNNCQSTVQQNNRPATETG